VYARYRPQKRKHVLMISGTPGSGKSTIVNRIAEALRKRGFRVKISRMTGFHMFNYVFLYCLARAAYPDKRLFHKLVIKGKIHPISLIRKEYIVKMHTLEMLLEVLSICLTFLLKVFLPLKLGYDVIIVDEGTINIIGNYIAAFKDAHEDMLQKIVFYPLMLTKAILCKASLNVFFINANYSALEARWKSRGFPPLIEETPFASDFYPKYLKCLRNAKELFKGALHLKVIEIDTSSNDLSQIDKVVLGNVRFI